MLTQYVSRDRVGRMEPLSTDHDRSRRDGLLERLAAFVQTGIDLDVDQRKKKRDEIPISARRVLSVSSIQIAQLEHEAFRDTMSMLESYSTEVLEQVALSFTKIKRDLDCLHRWLSYNGREWNTMTGERRDAMFLDILALRYLGWSTAEYRVHSLLDTYRVLKLNPGSIHMMPSDEVKAMVEPVFKYACASRSIIWLRRGGQRHTFDKNGNYVPPAEPVVHEDVSRHHLTEEIAQYAINNPERYMELWECLSRKKQSLPEMDFELFVLEMSVHAPLRDGVL